MIFKTAQIKTIDVENEESWRGKVFVTLDLDWAPDYVLLHTLNILKQSQINATIFATHQSSLLKEMNSNIEIGIHPNYNSAIFGEKLFDNINRPVNDLLKIFPNSTSLRSHSMTQSSHLLSSFRSAGIIHDCNHFIPHSAKINLKPWKIWNGLIKVPYFWEDDLEFIAPNFKLLKLNLSDLQVFDFHPVHIYLNTASVKQYSEAKNYLNDENRIQKYRQTDKVGTRDLFLQLISNF